MKKIVFAILAILCCSCVSKSKYDNLQSQYYDLEEELQALKSEKHELNRILWSHNIQIEELEDELDKFDNLLNSVSESTTDAMNEVHKATNLLYSDDSFQVRGCLDRLESILFVEALLLTNNGY